MKKAITISALLLCLSAGVEAQIKDSSTKRRSAVDHNNTKNKTKADKQRSQDRMSRRDSALALPPEEESRRSPSSAVPPNTPQ
jgi:hypothetical protein